MLQVDVEAIPLERLNALLAPERADRVRMVAERAGDLLGDRVIWNVNATAHGGGVAEMLQILVAYGRGAGVDVRWLVLTGDPQFFQITKRLHNALHGEAGDGSGLGAEEHAHYRRVLDANVVELIRSIRPQDVVLLHDPQTAGLIRGVHAAGARVVWRCHIGRDTPNEQTELGWEFLRGYLQQADGYIFSRAQYVPTWLPRERVRIILPSIDPNAIKNRELDPGEARRILEHVGLLAGGNRDHQLTFTRRDGSEGTVRRHTNLIADGPPPPPDARLVLQVSRWDRLKDMGGVLDAFALHLTDAADDVHLVLAGPDVSGVADDPEGAGILAECRAAWQNLSRPIQQRVHMVCVPMDDPDENAVIVNALQRRADVVTQKSLFEGFGLTVTEAMWKARPVVASAVGGIPDQILDGVDGLLLPDPRDLPGFARLLSKLLGDEALAARLGSAAQARVREQFLSDRHLIQYVELFAELING